MNEERKMILQMLKDGNITVDEAARLLEAIPDEKEPEAAKPNMPKRIAILVTENGNTKVNVRLPFSLVRAGLKLGQAYGSIEAKFKEKEDEAQAAISSLKNLDIGELLEGITDGDIILPYTVIDADDDAKNQHIQIILE